MGLPVWVIAGSGPFVKGRASGGSCVAAWPAYPTGREAFFAALRQAAAGKIARPIKTDFAFLAHSRPPP
jgi:hypothetical protein